MPTTRPPDSVGAIPPSLCIDLGAAFTKVAYRGQPGDTTHLLKDPGLTFDPGRFCIPSVAARDRESGRWVFGADAMDLRSGSRIEVFQNWKADLFLPDSERPGGMELLEGATPEAAELLMDHHPHLRALDVAARYLCWLFDEQLPAMFGHRDFTRARVQLCVPEFVRDDPAFTAAIDLVMRWAGFRNPGGFTLSEPKANLMGILTQGENHLTRAGRPHLGMMLGNAEVLRVLAKPDQAILFVDVGAYTTDLALVNLARHEEGAFADAPSSSERRGVRVLDDLLLREAPEAVRAQVEATAAARETFHQRAYGLRHTLDADLVDLGLTSATLDACAESFAGAILHHIGRFLESKAAEEPFAVVLTGGGANIAGVRDRLVAALVEREVRWFHAPHDATAPPTVLHNALSDELVRGASAIGGASILFV